MRRQPKLDLDSGSGQSATGTQGDLRVDDVYFRYSARKERPVLQSLTLDAAPGKVRHSPLGRLPLSVRSLLGCAAPRAVASA
jgi:hypothetical protein